MDKTGRNGFRMGDLFRTDAQTRYSKLKEKHLSLLNMYPEVDFDLAAEEKAWWKSIDELKNLKVIDTVYFINEAIRSGKRVLAEGAQGSMLDIDFGTYPFVTSSNTVTAGVCTGLGIAPKLIGKVIGISKAYCTRVGSGPFPSELHDEVGESLRKAGHEFGATTGRPRRCGWIDIPQLKYTIMVNGVDEIVLTKMDVLDIFDQVGIATHYEVNNEQTTQLPYEYNSDLSVNVKYLHGWNDSVTSCRAVYDLPEQGKIFVNTLQQLLGVNIKLISVGPGRDEIFYA